MTRYVVSGTSSSGGSGTAVYGGGQNFATGMFGTGLIAVYGAGTGTFTVPAGITSVRVRLWGGGGSGPTTTSHYGAAAGGFALKTITGLTAGTNIPVTVGVGGTSSATTGGTSSFGSYVSATGGNGGSSSQPTAGTGSGGDVNYTGGTCGYAYCGGGGAPSIFGPGNDGYFGQAIHSVSAKGGAGGGQGNSSYSSSQAFQNTAASIGTMQRHTSPNTDAGSNYNWIYTGGPSAMPLTSIDMIGTGPGGSPGGPGLNGGGGGGYAYGAGNGGQGGFPGGGGGYSSPGADGLVIVEY